MGLFGNGFCSMLPLAAASALSDALSLIATSSLASCEVHKPSRLVTETIEGKFWTMLLAMLCILLYIFNHIYIIYMIILIIHVCCTYDMLQISQISTSQKPRKAESFGRSF
jgi:hypothetical protein